MHIIKVIFNWWSSLFSTQRPPTPILIKTNHNKALCIGINNYPGSANDLKGCVNDAQGWKKLLIEKYNYTVDTLLDKNANIKNVKSKFKKMVKNAKENDSIVLTFSGHGTTKPDYNRDEIDGKDEALCLYDGLLIDDTIRKILKDLPKGVKFTFISDSCHSGTVTRAFMSTINVYNAPIPKYLPPEHVIESIALDFLPIKRAVFTPQSDMQEILISGCKANEYSYDASFNGQSKGAFSHYALLILQEQPKITYADFYKRLREKLPDQHYPQTPQLEGSVKHKNTLMF